MQDSYLQQIDAFVAHEDLATSQNQIALHEPSMAVYRIMHHLP
jgi:hypothetical protein